MKPSNDDAAVLKTLWEAAHYLTPEEVSGRTGLSIKRVKVALRRLEREGLIASEGVH